MEVLQNATLVVASAAALAAVVGRARGARRAGTRRAVAAAVLALPLVVFGGEILATWAVGRVSPLPEAGVVLLALVPAALLLAAAEAYRRWPHRAPSRPWPAGALVALALAAAPAAFLDIALGSQEPQRALHAWSATIAPAGPEPWTVRLPFVLPRGEPGEPASYRAWRNMDELRNTLRVAQGEGSLHGIGDGSHLEILGRGAVRVEAVRAFYGTPGDRESFPLEPASRNVSLAAGGPPSAEVVWSVRMSGGEGHSCGEAGDLRARVEAGASARLEGGDTGLERGTFAVACA